MKKLNFFRVVGLLALFFAFPQIHAQTYCPAGPSSSVDSEIDAVSLTGDTYSINSSTRLCSATGIQDFTATDSADLSTGAAYSVTIAMSYCGSYGYSGTLKAWIDFNADGDFDDAGEELGSYYGTPSSKTFTFTVPGGATLGSTRMRVMQREGSGAATPCATFSWGDVEDYTINITNLNTPSCIAPGALVVTNVGKTSADIAWSGSAGSGYFLVEYDTAGFIPGTGDTAWVYNDTTFSATGLSSATGYEFYVTSICNLKDSSSTSGPLAATTFVSCFAPSNLGGTLGYYDAELSWDGDADATAYVVEYGLFGFTLGSGTMVTVTDTTASITGLTDDTQYSFYVYTLCSAGDTSAVVGPVVGTTPKAPVEACGDITLILKDSYGDGWQGGTLNVYSTTDTTSYTFSTGSSQSCTISHADHATLRSSWMDRESW